MSRLRQAGRFALAAALVATSTQARAEGEPAELSVKPSFALETAFDDNIFATDHDEESSFAIALRPRLELGYRTQTFDIGADLGTDIIRYTDYFSSAGAELWRMSGHAQVGLLPGLTFRVANAFVPNPIAGSIPADAAGNMVQTNRTDAELRYWSALPGEREIAFGLRGARFDSDDFSEQVPGGGGTVILDDDFNADYFGGSGYLELQQPLGTRTSLYSRAHAGYRSFDESPRSDNIEYTLLVGLRSLRFRNTEIDVAGGYGRIHFASLGSAPRILGRVNLRYRMASGWSWSLGANHLSSADLLGNDALETTGSLGIEKRFQDGRTSAGVNVFVTRFDTDSVSGGANLWGGAEVQLRRQLTRRTQLRIGYRHWRNAGGYELDDMMQNRLLLELALRY